MILRAPLLFAFISLYNIGITFAQSEGPVFTYDSSIKVYDQSGNEQVMAWGGGFNRPEFAIGDINGDGLQDLVVLEPWIGLRTFINTGTATSPKYVYAPKYALNFPPVTDYIVLADYNDDHVPDLFTQQSANGIHHNIL